MYKRFFSFFLFFFLAASSVFSQQDSLFDDWNKRLDAVNFSNIDMLPIYRFTLHEVRSEFKQYENQENTSSDDRSKQKQSDLHWKINYISNILEQRLLHMDSLFYAKALQREQEGNEKEAIFYYKRSLDFNPSYCLSIEKLSYIYARNYQNKQHIELLDFLSLDNRLKDCSLQIFDFAFDSLIIRANNLIECHNYYDALKVLDTMKIFLGHLPQEKYTRTYDILLETAQNGIYTSYYDVINKSIKVNNLFLAKEYILGLSLVIENNKQLPNQNFFFLGSVQNLVFAHRSNVHTNIERKQYAKAIETTDSLVLFLNNLKYLYPDNLFFDIYATAYTKQYSVMVKNEDSSASEFYQKYNIYITVPEFIKKKHFEKITIKENVLKQNLINKTAAQDENSLTEIKLLISETLSKINQYAWSNELLKAIDLLEKIDSIFVQFALQEDSILAKKNAETTDLVEQRIKKYAYEETQSSLAKARGLIAQKQYYSAYLLLIDKNPIIERTLNKLEMESLAKQIELPASFQKEEQEAKEMLETGYFSAGFQKYEQVYAYYEKYEIEQYGLEYDNLQDFVVKSNREEYFKQLTFYYIKNCLCEKTIANLFYVQNKNMGNKEWLENVGNEMKKAKCCDELVKKQSFSKKDKPFLDTYFGGKNSWWYIVKSYFKKKK